MQATDVYQDSEGHEYELSRYWTAVRAVRKAVSALAEAAGVPEGQALEAIEEQTNLLGQRARLSRGGWVVNRV